MITPPDPEEGGTSSLDDHYRQVLSTSLAVDPKSTSNKDLRFVKLVEASKVKLGYVAAKRKIIALTEKGLIGHFTGLWLSPKTIESWLSRN